MIYEKFSLTDAYGRRLRAIMDGALSTYTTYDGHDAIGKEVDFRAGELIVFKPREAEL